MRSEATDFVTLVNSMSYSLRVAATLLRGLMLIYDKQWVYLGKCGLELGWWLLGVSNVINFDYL